MAHTNAMPCPACPTCGQTMERFLVTLHRYDPEVEGYVWTDAEECPPMVCCYDCDNEKLGVMWGRVREVVKSEVQ